MSETADASLRTEEPTPKRLEDARRKGDAPRSPEVVTVAMLSAAGIGVWLLSGALSEGVVRAGLPFLERPHDFTVDARSMAGMFATLSLRIGLLCAAFAALFVIAAILGNVAQAAPVLAPQRLSPKLSKLSPVEGFKRIFGGAAIANFLKGVFKLGVVGSILTYALWPERDMLAGLLYADQIALTAIVRDAVLRLIAATLGAMIVIAALDYAHQKSVWRRRLRMTKEEVRRELKEQEGDPAIKARVRQQRETRARRRMMVAVKDATVLIMNPTHYAVALSYEAGSAGAPVCVAKGLDDLALRLRAEAEKAGVPVVENPPLARALHAAVELDHEIPVEHYEAVAKVIGFIMRRARPGGLGAAPRTQ